MSLNLFWVLFCSFLENLYSHYIKFLSTSFSDSFADGEKKSMNFVLTTPFKFTSNSSSQNLFHDFL